jgi:hypothetical protein
MLEQCGQREMEARPAPAGQIRRSQPTAVRFDDRSADGEADAHAALLGREEALKQVVELTCGYARLFAAFVVTIVQTCACFGRRVHPLCRVSAPLGAIA